MAIYQLLKDIPIFPSPKKAQSDGLLAIGGDLSKERLIEAYKNGIFPWYEDGQPILWWSPDPRLVLYPNELKISRRFKKFLKKKIFKISVDTAFHKLIENCANTRLIKGEGTWITKEMKNAYINLYKSGYAHSIESWYKGQLVGGLYGVQIGYCFFGESMFSIMSNASKCALVALANYSQINRVRLIDCQMSTEHLKTMGAREINRDNFLEQLKKNISKDKKIFIQ